MFATPCYGHLLSAMTNISSFTKCDPVTKKYVSVWHHHCNLSRQTRRCYCRLACWVAHQHPWPVKTFCGGAWDSTCRSLGGWDVASLLPKCPHQKCACRPQLVKWLARGWTIHGSIFGAGENFHNCLDQPRGPHTLLYNGYWVYFTVVNWPGHLVDHSPHLAPRFKIE
jgi:hypothetical protein